MLERDCRWEGMREVARRVTHNDPLQRVTRLVEDLLGSVRKALSILTWISAEGLGSLGPTPFVI